MATKTVASKATSKKPVATGKAKAPAKATTTAGTASNAIERKALAQKSKSGGMRMLFDAGYSVTRVKAVFNAPYGFVYGVAKRHGVVDTAAARRAPRKAPVARVAKAKVTTKVTKVASRAAAKPKTATQRVAARIAAKAPAAKVKGRPTAARRAANRKQPVAVSA